MKVLIIGDVHLSDRPPSSCTDTYADDLFDLLCQAAEVVDKESCKAVVQAGDYWHHKAPGRTSHRLVQRAIRQLREFPCPVYIVVGNHDVLHDQVDSVEVTQPLGVLFESGAARRLDGWADDADGALEFPLYGVPWQQQWSSKAIGTALRDYTDPTGREWNRPVLVVTHAPLYPPGQEPHYEGAEFTPASWWAEAMGNQGYLLYGHIHEPHGVWQHEGVTFCNYGALSRGSLDEYNVKRQVGVTIWDTEAPPERAFEFVPLDARPAEEVFRLRRHAEVKGTQRRLDLFLSGVDAVTLGLLNVESVIAHIREGGHPVPVVDLAEELLMSQQGGTR